MTYTTDIRSSKISVGFAAPVANAITAFKGLTIDEQLGLLWVLYDNMGRSITPAAPGAARLQFAAGLLADVKAMSHQEQLQFMRDLVAKKDTPMTRSYGVLSNNTKLAFWYQLAEAMRTGEVVPVPTFYKLSQAALGVFGQISRLEFNQQITVLRQAVVDMGVDPIA
jgi:hypothetical protein